MKKYYYFASLVLSTVILFLLFADFRHVLDRAATAEGAAGLINTLHARDTNVLDLVEVGKDLVKKYGRDRSDKIVRLAWAHLTSAKDPAMAGDVMWLQHQSPRVRDVGWMLTYESEWLK
jgi:hypothetical protein